MSLIACQPLPAVARRLPCSASVRGVPPRSWLRPSQRALRQREHAERAAVRERERILRDLHDGCGGKLLAALQLAECEAPAARVADALRDCIDDLRITLDGMDPLCDDLAPVLAAQRDRMEARLAGLPLRLEWQLDCADALTPADEGDVVHVLRILQEAFTNVLKHAHASVVRIEGRVQAAGRRELQLRIRDDGQGLASGRRGRGLGNMARRAAMIGGALELGREQGWTQVLLRVPLRQG